MPAFLVLAAVVSGVVGVFISGTGSAAPPVIPAQRVATFPHDQRAFCQGLAVHKGRIVEGTGRYRQSTLRRVTPESGQVESSVALPADVFGEGITVWQDQIIQLTWQNGYLIVYDADSLAREFTISYRNIDRSFREGWGITHDGTHLIISDGSPYLRFVDPITWKLVRRLKVKSGRRSVRKLNELEFVNGEILANIWYSSRIARINPKTGSVTGWVELKTLQPRSVRHNNEAVFNGIAWDAEHRRLYVTGKLWPELHQITFDGLPTTTD